MSVKVIPISEAYRENWEKVFKEVKEVAKKGGNVAKKAKDEIELNTGESVVKKRLG